MLAYVFWHWRRADVAPAVYEELLLAFQRALRTTPPAGFTDGRSFALRGASWAAAGGDAYEDWYVLDDSAALDRLDAAAVSAARQQPHDLVAAAAAGGAAGLYALRRGADLPQARHAYWFSKPAGRSYQDVFDALAPVIGDGRGALWCRRLVLGPTPEFCLQTLSPVVPPGIGDPLHLTLRPVTETPAG